MENPLSFEQWIKNEKHLVPEIVIVCGNLYNECKEQYEQYLEAFEKSEE